MRRRGRGGGILRDDQTPLNMIKLELKVGLASLLPDTRCERHCSTLGDSQLRCSRCWRGTEEVQAVQVLASVPPTSLPTEWMNVKRPQRPHRNIQQHIKVMEMWSVALNMYKGQERVCRGYLSWCKRALLSQLQLLMSWISCQISIELLIFIPSTLHC